VIFLEAEPKISRDEAQEPADRSGPAHAGGATAAVKTGDAVVKTINTIGNYGEALARFRLWPEALKGAGGN
jgi:hypothetical protein